MVAAAGNITTGRHTDNDSLVVTPEPNGKVFRKMLDKDSNLRWSIWSIRGTKMIRSSSSVDSFDDFQLFCSAISERHLGTKLCGRYANNQIFKSFHHHDQWTFSIHLTLTLSDSTILASGSVSSSPTITLQYTQNYSHSKKWLLCGINCNTHDYMY